MKAYFLGAALAAASLTALAVPTTAGAQVATAAKRPLPMSALEPSEGGLADQNTRSAFVKNDGDVKRMAAAALRPTERGTVHAAHTLDGQDDGGLGQ